MAMWWQQGDKDTTTGDQSSFITNDDLAEMEKLFAVRDNPKQSRFRRLGRGGKKDKKEGEVSDASTDDVLVRAAKKHAHLMHALPAQRANNVEITVRKLKIDDRHIKVRPPPPPLSRPLTLYYLAAFIFCFGFSPCIFFVPRFSFRPLPENLISARTASDFDTGYSGS